MVNYLKINSKILLWIWPKSDQYDRSASIDQYQRYLAATEWDDKIYVTLPLDSEYPNRIAVVNINNTKICVMVDTGPAVNVIDEQTARANRVSRSKIEPILL